MFFKYQIFVKENNKYFVQYSFLMEFWKLLWYYISNLLGTFRKSLHDNNDVVIMCSPTYLAAMYFSFCCNCSCIIIDHVLSTIFYGWILIIKKTPKEVVIIIKNWLDIYDKQNKHDGMSSCVHFVTSLFIYWQLIILSCLFWLKTNKC